MISTAWPLDAITAAINDIIVVFPSPVFTCKKLFLWLLLVRLFKAIKMAMAWTKRIVCEPLVVSSLP